MIQEVVWKDVVGYEGYYKVSSIGSIWSVRSERCLSLKGKSGRARDEVTVCLCVGKKTMHRVHRLVAEAFIPNPENKSQVNHIDGDRANNSVLNLEWNSPKENIDHAVKTGLMKYPSGSSSRGFKGVIEVYNKKGLMVDKLNGAKEMKDKGYDPTQVYACVRGKQKTHRTFTYIRTQGLEQIKKLEEELAKLKEME